MTKKRKRDAFTASLVQKTAEITSKKTDFVYKVIRGDRENERVMEVYMGLLENTKEVFNNALVTHAAQLVPFE